MEHPIAALEMWMHGAESLPCRGVGTEVGDLEIRMTVDQTDQLTTGVTGRTEDGDSM